MMVYLISYPDQVKKQNLGVLCVFVVQFYFLPISELRPLTSEMSFVFSFTP